MESRGVAVRRDRNRGAMGGEKRRRRGSKVLEERRSPRRRESHGDRRDDRTEAEAAGEVKSLRIGVHHANAVVWGPVSPKRA